MRSKMLVVAVLAILLGVFVVPAQAWEKGHVKVNPFVKYEQQYESNVFYVPTDPQHDFISILTPGVTSEFGLGDEGRQKIRANYLVDCGMFGRFNDQNYANHDINGDVELNFAEKYKWTTGDRFLITSDRAGTEFSTRTLRNENTLRSLFEADYNKLSWDLGYSIYNIDYHSKSLNAIDYYKNSVWTTGYIKIMPKTKALLELMYNNLQYPDASGRNGNGYRAMTGLKGDITEKVTGIVKGGFKIQDYNSSKNPDWYSFVAEIGVGYKYSERLNFLFSYLREPFESTYTNNNYYTGDHFTASMDYQFGNGFFANANGHLYNNVYPEAGTGESKKRHDVEWSAGTKLGYMWKKWIVADVGYNFQQRASNIHSRKYDDNIISASVKAMF